MKSSRAVFLLCLVFILGAVTESFAADKIEQKLKDEYGYDLTRVPFFLRFDFFKKYNKPWKDTYYTERKEFLIKYDADLDAQKAKDKADAKAQAQEEKDKLKAKKEQEQKDKARLKARMDKEKADKKAEAARQKQFRDTLRAQREELRKIKDDFQRQQAGRM